MNQGQGQGSIGYLENKNCRLCSSTLLDHVLDLGEQYFSGIFPKTVAENVPKAPIRIVRCSDCGLVQLDATYDPDFMYGPGYGYRSGLNSSMLNHLSLCLDRIITQHSLDSGKVFLDIGSNDGSLLNEVLRRTKMTCVGIDPTIRKFESYYNPDIVKVRDFFSDEKFLSASGGLKATFITSIAMFYDLADPCGFACQIAKVLAKDGIWFVEQAYLPSVIKNNAFDVFCHEHLCLYTLNHFHRVCRQAGLKIVDVEINDANGGSFAAMVRHGDHAQKPSTKVASQLQWESDNDFLSHRPFLRFSEKIQSTKRDLRKLLIELKRKGKTVAGYGASTKGNVILQYCQISRETLPILAEVNADKVGRFTPGTLIPIASEIEVLGQRPDFLLVLPWSFKDHFLRKERAYLEAGGSFIFPLPNLNVISNSIETTRKEGSHILW